MDSKIILLGLAAFLMAAKDDKTATPTSPSYTGSASDGTTTVKMSLGIDALPSLGITSDGTLVWDPAGFWSVWKNGRTINLNQYNGEASAEGKAPIVAPSAPSTFDYHAVGINIPTYNPPAAPAPAGNPLAGIDPWAVFPSGVGGGAAGGYTTAQVNAASAMLTAANDPSRSTGAPPPQSPGVIPGYPTFDPTKL